MNADCSPLWLAPRKTRITQATEKSGREGELMGHLTDIVSRITTANPSGHDFERLRDFCARWRAVADVAVAKGLEANFILGRSKRNMRLSKKHSRFDQPGSGFGYELKTFLARR